MWRQRRQKVDDEERVVKDADRARERTMNRAVRLLAAKPRSVAELRERLLEKLWTNEQIVDGVIEKLREYKYLDDEQYARDLAMSRLRQKPQGRRRLQQTLSQKQLDKNLVATAITEAFEKMPEENLATEAIERRLRSKGAPKSREDVKKFYDHLLRLGFSYDLVRTKMSELAAKRAES